MRLVALFCLLFGLAAGEELTILYTGSSNGNLRHCDCLDGPYGGLPRRKTLIDSLRNQHKNVFVFDTGDLFNPFTDAFKDSIFFEAFNEIRYDAVGIGDQEFINGVDFFLSRLRRSKNPFTSANVRFQGKLVAPSYILKNRVAVISVLDPNSLAFYAPKDIAGLEVDNPRDALKRVLEEIGNQADIIVLLSHVGYDLETELGAEFPRLSVIINGHTQNKIKTPEKTGNALHVGAGPDAKWLGVLTITYSGNKISNQSHTLIPLSAEIKDDPAILKITEGYFKRVGEIKPPAGSKDTTEIRGAAGAKRLEFTLFYARDCEHCISIMNKFLPPLAARYPITVKYRSVDEPDNYLLLTKMEKERGVGEQELPVAFIGKKVLGSEPEIRAQLEGIIKEMLRTGTLAAPAETLNPPTVIQTPARIELVYFYQYSCSRCARTEYLLNALRKQYPELVITRYDMEKSENKKLAEAFGIKYKVAEKERLITPSVFIGDGYLAGETVKYENIVALFEHNRGRAIPWPAIAELKDEAHQSIVHRFRSLGIFGVLFAGLLDGINPCAFTTLGFFIAYLGMLGIGGRRILAVASGFIVGVFVTYFAVGLGAYKLLAFLSPLKIVARALVGITAGIVWVFAGLSVYDFIKARQGKTGEMKLKMPEIVKKRIHASIRENTWFGGYLIGAFLLGAFISLLELVCTGQVYLPTIIFISGLPGLKAHAFFYLLLYNLCFIIPLVIVFLIAYFGVFSLKTQVAFIERVPLVKILTAIFFFVLGGVLFYLLFAGFA
jgi:glutaredoxin